MAVNEAAAPVAVERPRRDAMPPALLGVILFVASECVFFAALFGAYFTVRAAAPVWPPKGIEGLEIPLPAVSATMLVPSSVKLQFAVWAVRRGAPRSRTLAPRSDGGSGGSRVAPRSDGGSGGSRVRPGVVRRVGREAER